MKRKKKEEENKTEIERLTRRRDERVRKESEKKIRRG